MSDTWNQAGDVLATFGEISAFIGVIVSIIVCIVLIIIGTVLIVRKSNFGLGIVLIIVGFVVAGLSFVIYHFVSNNKGVAAVYGGVSILNVFSGGCKKKTKNS